MAEGRAGGVGSRDVGGGFDGNPGGPSRDGANDDHDPADRNRYRRKPGGRSRLPAEYADFKLADGRTLRDVMGDGFFGSAGQAAAGKWLSKGVLEKLRQGSLPIPSGKSKKARPPARDWRAEQQARREELRARVEAKRGARPGGNLNFGGWS